MAASSIEVARASAPTGPGAPGKSSGPSASSGTSGQSGGTAPPPTPLPSRYLTERFDSIGSLLTGQDASLPERISQTPAVLAAFLTSPLLRGGLRVPIPLA